jgi:hypothetical protein
MALAFTALGCAGGSDAPVKVVGVILLDGQPVPGATVQFSPVDGKGQGAYGLTQDDGTFELSCQNGVPGAPPGQYKVVVRAAAAPQMEAPTDPDQAMRMADQMMRGNAAKKGRAARPRSAVPTVYTNEKTTPLQQTVPPPGGKVTLDLKSH